MLQGKVQLWTPIIQATGETGTEMERELPAIHGRADLAHV